MRRVWLLGRVLTVGFFAIGVLAACGTATGPEPSGIEGEWTWIRAFGGIAGMEINPQTSGYSMTIEFAGERARVLRDGALFAETTVEIRPVDAAGRSGTVVYTEPILGWPEQSFQLGSGDTLRLADGCCDGFEYTFARAQ